MGRIKRGYLKTEDTGAVYGARPGTGAGAGQRGGHSGLLTAGEMSATSGSLSSYIYNSGSWINIQMAALAKRLLCDFVRLLQKDAPHR